MPQVHFPFFPEGVTHINADIAFAKRDGRVFYFSGQSVVFGHDEADLQSFRMITSQFCVNGTIKQAEISRAFGVPLISVKRGVKRYREQGSAGFFAERRRRGAAVLTPPVLVEAQQLLDEGLEVREVGQRLGLKPNTLAKAVGAGRLHRPAPREQQTPASLPSSKSQRSAEDSAAPMGVGATNTLERVAASLGQLCPSEVKFQPGLDIPNGGVLLALPALLALGLLRHTEKHFELPRGYYGMTSIFLLLGFMALARLKSVEALRYCAPGEWGKLLGLDRVPEVRTLRTKLDHLSQHGQPAQWSAELCSDWMSAFPGQATAFYVDGHVRIYHGKQTKLPRRFVSRQKLCLRASTDYWVNAMDGQPFFVVYQDVDPGLIKVLENEIVPRLESDAPNQPSEEALEENPLLHRFTLVFDREGYSPKLFRDLKERRIACLTYRKSPGKVWREDEFFTQKVTLVSGNVVDMRLAERGTLLGSKPSERVWVRELRRLMPSGHQTSVISTDYRSDLGPVAAAMFARWCQENFFKYMGENYGIDRMVSYQTEDLPDTLKVVNPEYRRLDREIRSKRAILSRKTADFGVLELANDDERSAEKMEADLQTQAQLHEGIVLLRADVEELKKKRKAAGKHVKLGDLPEEQRFKGLSKGTKQLLDTIKMVAYRSETSMAHTLRERMSRNHDARSLLRAIYTTEVDLLPDYDQGILRVRLHRQANPSTDRAIRHLCSELNDTETVFPGTDLQLSYELVTLEEFDAKTSPGQNPVSSQNPRDQEV